MPSYEYTLVLGGWRRTKIHPRQSAPGKSSSRSLKKSAVQQQRDSPKSVSHTTTAISMISHINASSPSMERYSSPRPFSELPRPNDHNYHTPVEYRECGTTGSKNLDLDRFYHQKHQERTRKHGPKHVCCISVHASDHSSPSLDNMRQTPPNKMEMHTPETPCKNCGYLDNRDLQQMRPHNPFLTGGASRLKPSHRILSFANAWREFSFHIIAALDFFNNFDVDFREETRFTTNYAHMGTINQMWKNKILQNEKYGGRPKVGLRQDGDYFGVTRPQRSYRAVDIDSKNACQLVRLSTFNDIEYNLERSTFDLLNSQLLPPRLRGHYELDIGDDDDYSDPRDVLDLLRYRNAKIVLERISQWSSNLFPLFAETSRRHSSMRLLLAELKYMVDTISNSERMLPGAIDLSASMDSSHVAESLSAAADEGHDRNPPRGRSRSRSRSRSRNQTKRPDAKDKSSVNERTHEDNMADPISKDQTKGKGKPRSGD